MKIICEIATVYNNLKSFELSAAPQNQQSEKKPSQETFTKWTTQARSFDIGQKPASEAAPAALLINAAYKMYNQQSKQVRL
jgi:hypothetical protein